MYDILDVYARPYNPEYPVVCIDEKSKQLLWDPVAPIPMKPWSPYKEDCRYIRWWTRNIFVAVEPKWSKRFVKVTKRRKKKDTAQFLKEIVMSKYKKAKKVVIVWDNLNTHFESSFYETFSKEEAEKILSRIELHYTPTHASRLDQAEIEINAMTTECLWTRRLWNAKTLKKELKVRATDRNNRKVGIKRSFTREKADQKLWHRYV